MAAEPEACLSGTLRAVGVQAWQRETLANTQEDDCERGILGSPDAEQVIG